MFLLNKSLSEEEVLHYSNMDFNQLHNNIDNKDIYFLYKNIFFRLDPRHFDKSTNILLDISQNKIDGCLIGNSQCLFTKSIKDCISEIGGIEIFFPLLLVQVFLF